MPPEKLSQFRKLSVLYSHFIATRLDKPHTTLSTGFFIIKYEYKPLTLRALVIFINKRATKQVKVS